MERVIAGFYLVDSPPVLNSISFISPAEKKGRNKEGKKIRAHRQETRR